MSYANDNGSGGGGFLAPSYPQQQQQQQGTSTTTAATVTGLPPRSLTPSFNVSAQAFQMPGNTTTTTPITAPLSFSASARSFEPVVSPSSSPPGVSSVLSTSSSSSSNTSDTLNVAAAEFNPSPSSPTFRPSSGPAVGNNNPSVVSFVPSAMDGGGGGGGSQLAVTASEFVPSGAVSAPSLHAYSPQEHLDYGDMSHLSHAGTSEREWYERRGMVGDDTGNDTVTDVSFDPVQELTWVAYQSGRVTSYLNGTMEKYTAFSAHTEEVRRVSVSKDSDTVVTFSSDNIRCHTRGGLLKLSFTHEDMKELSCAHFALPGTSRSPHEIILGSTAGGLFRFDLEKGRLTKEVPLNDGVVCVSHSSRMVVCGGTKGDVTLHDPRSYRIEQVFPRAHTGGLASIDVKGDLLVTCGWSAMGRGGMRHHFADPMMKVYDVRTMRQLAPIPCPLGPTLLKFHPKFSSTLHVVTQTGCFQVVDINAGTPETPPPMHPMNLTDSVMAFDVSPTGEMMAFGDAGGYVHQWSDRDDCSANMYSEPTYRPLPYVEPPVAVRENTPLCVLRPPPSSASSASSSSAHKRKRKTAASMLLGVAGKGDKGKGKEAPHDGDDDGPSSLLSHWPEQLAVRVGALPAPSPLDNADVTRDLVQRDFVGYIANRSGIRRYTSSCISPPSPPLGPTSDAEFEAMFDPYDEEELLPVPTGNDSDVTPPASPSTIRVRTPPHSPSPNAPHGITPSPVKILRPPRHLRHTEAKMRWMAVEGFDFGSYNRSSFTGLENSLPNSYVNPFVQLLYFIPQLRQYLLNYLTVDDASLSCELGFLFHMMDRCGGRAVEPRNFLRTLHRISAARTEGLFEDPFHEESLRAPARLAESFWSFLIGKLNKETTAADVVPAYSSQPRQTQIPIIEKLFGQRLTVKSQCLMCNNNKQQDKLQFTTDLRYPRDRKDASASSFASLIRRSLEWEGDRDGVWCEHCCKATKHTQSTRPVELPAMLCINTAISREDNTFWGKRKGEKGHYMGGGPPPSWLPLRMRVQLGADRLKIQEYSDTQERDASDMYELYAIITDICDPIPKTHKHNFVAHIHVPSYYSSDQHRELRKSASGIHTAHNPIDGLSASPSSSSRDGPVWYTFNDFTVSRTSFNEVVHFSSWHTPFLLVYRKRDLVEAVPIPQSINPVTSGVFDEHTCLSSSTSQAFVRLPQEHLPGAGDKVAIDAEFVALESEQFELTPTGQRRTIKPGRFGLARVSVIIAEGPRKGTCFIDDYICKDEPVADYLTKFSGIHPGDLDPAVSTHNLTTLKSAYLKLRCLVDRGVVFVGHGLKKDFRILNLTVPKHQVIDTVEIFYQRRQRKLSLKFLASYTMGLFIQSETHCSIEDSKTALLLYDCYVTLNEEGLFESVLEDIYQYGRKHAWKVDPAHPPPRIVDTETIAKAVHLMEGNPVVSE